MLLYNQDCSMVLMEPNQEHILHLMDLNVGKVVETWMMDPIIPLAEILPTTKNGNASAATNLEKMEVTTTASGMLAVGSLKGSISLYNDLEKKAKTELSGLGDDIIGIDTTESGKWIVATCETHVLLVCTEAKDAKDVNKATFSGFN
ncbi:hypothetical protein HDU98_005857 [Podochytrium sp. JEL0797]|nr:hypothetical protein HDU98_005857 [Podochytrium sp. JEL0797]